MKYVKHIALVLILLSKAFASNIDQKQILALQKQITQLQNQLNALKTNTNSSKKKKRNKSKTTKNRQFKKNVQNYYTTPVTTSAIWGVVSDYDGSDLVVSYSSMNQDLMLLKHRYKLNYPIEKNRPTIQLSGALEAQAGIDKFAYKTSSDINLSRFELDILAEINPWVATLTSINYDDSATANIDRTKYSSLYVKRAFITVGNLKSSKYYATFGQFHMPFGRYSTLMLTSTIVSKIGKNTGRGMLLGYYGLDNNETGLNGSLYIMQNKTAKPNKQHKLNQGGVNLNWNQKITSKKHFQLGGGLIRNIADSDHISSILYDANTIDKLSYTVPGANVYSILSINDWRIGIEGTKALKEMIADNVSYNQFSALHAEVDYALGMHNLPSNLYISFDKSWHSELIQTPQQSWSIGAYAHFWKNTLQAIEFRHNKAFNNDYTDISKNMALIQFGVYF